MLDGSRFCFLFFQSTKAEMFSSPARKREREREKRNWLENTQHTLEKMTVNRYAGGEKKATKLNLKYTGKRKTEHKKIKNAYEFNKNARE